MTVAFNTLLIFKKLYDTNKISPYHLAMLIIFSFFASLFALLHGILQLEGTSNTSFLSLFLLLCVWLDTFVCYSLCHMAILSSLRACLQGVLSHEKWWEEIHFLPYLSFLIIQPILPISMAHIGLCPNSCKKELFLSFTCSL